ncbi:site-specific DNA-methyltransferase [Nocardioides silvaticus]|uniref:Site-specific DNA-methyltransferase n=1 Tax=Nocardioides silvaticus TaxID=2201891 RepID=A0A316TI34_9ACTN|nr:DNA methyltransferase [Nocardioides silvaticus]PWN04253.1 site-specific DNA-methyltransferase [Nocardioides silvaticus]
MSRLNDLLRQLEANEKTAAIAKELRTEYDALVDRRAFGLNFERHTPETVELPGRTIRRGDKVHVLPERGKNPTAENSRLWRVVAIDRSAGIATVEDTAVQPAETQERPLTELVVVAEFRDPIYPGLVSTGKVECGGDKPFHAVINAENYHALQTLLFTHRGRVDCIYIDPPYNTGARDWKYSNDYVESDDLYRHSKWLAFMERRLLLARDLLNPEESVLIVTIDEREQSRLALLLEQVFPEASTSMVTSVISPQGSARPGSFSRVEEYLFVVRIGGSEVQRTGDDMLIEAEKAVDAPVWFSMIRSGTDARREDSKNLFYPIFVEESSRRIVDVGDALPLGDARTSVPDRPGLRTIWPIRRDGSEGRWQLSASTFREYARDGFAKVGEKNPAGNFAIMYIRTGDRARILAGDIERQGTDQFGYAIYRRVGGASSSRIPKSVWNKLSHDAGKQGSMLVSSLLGGRKFPFPKSLYAVEDAIRFFVLDKPEAVVVDFFGGSGTTGHAVMRLNKLDGGRRRSIVVTNNEVSFEEQRALRARGLRPGDEEWDRFGICEWITKPRLKAAITGKTPDGEPVKLDYKFNGEFPMKEGLQENVEFFTLTYEAPLRVSSSREFARVAPLLWMRAGSQGRRIDDVSAGFDVVDTYGVLADLDQTEPFLKAIAAREAEGAEIRMAFVVTDDDRLFTSVCRDLPEHVEAVRLYEAYLRNFEIEAGRSTR